MSFSLKIEPSHRRSGVSQHMDWARPTRMQIPNGILVQPLFCKCHHRHSRYTLQPAVPSLPIIAPSRGTIGLCQWLLGSPNPQPKQHLDWFSRFCTDHRIVSLCFATSDRPFPLSLPMGDLIPHLILGFPWAAVLDPNGISIC